MAPTPYLAVETDGDAVLLRVDGHLVRLSLLEAQYLALSLAEAASRARQVSKSAS